MEADGSYCFEHPYGTIPRLLLTWLATEAVRTKSAELMLGENLADFMGQLGLVPRGGVRGDITRLRSQMNRLFAARMTIEDYGDARRDLGVQLQVGFLKDLWWSDTDRNADQRSLLPSTVRLSAEFFKHITASPVPISLDALRSARFGSPAGHLHVACASDVLPAPSHDDLMGSAPCSVWEPVCRDSIGTLEVQEGF